MTAKRQDWNGRTRAARAGAMMAMLVALSTGCASTVDIGRLLESPGEYDGRTVQVRGTVTRGAGILGVGAYEVDDGTGTIVVIAQGQGVPARGARTKVKGRFESVFSWAGATIAAIIQEQESGGR